MPKQCQADGCHNNVFSNGYCKAHGYLRTDKKKPKLLKKISLAYSKHNNPLHKKSNTKSAINKISKSQQEKNKLYEKAKAEIREELIAENNFKCYFTGVELPDTYNRFHHIKGRDGDLTFDKEWLVPALDGPHLEYHDHDVVYLLNKTDWYAKFIMRLFLEEDPRFIHEMKRIGESEAGKVNYLNRFFGNTALGMLTKCYN